MWDNQAQYVNCQPFGLSPSSPNEANFGQVSPVLFNISTTHNSPNNVFHAPYLPPAAINFHNNLSASNAMNAPGPANNTLQYYPINVSYPPPVELSYANYQATSCSGPVFCDKNYQATSCSGPVYCDGTVRYPCPPPDLSFVSPDFYGTTLAQLKVTDNVRDDAAGQNMMPSVVAPPEENVYKGMGINDYMEYSLDGKSKPGMIPNDADHSIDNKVDEDMITNHVNYKVSQINNEMKTNGILNARTDYNAKVEYAKLDADTDFFGSCCVEMYDNYVQQEVTPQTQIDYSTYYCKSVDSYVQRTVTKEGIEDSTYACESVGTYVLKTETTEAIGDSTYSCERLDSYAQQKVEQMEDTMDPCCDEMLNTRNYVQDDVSSEQVEDSSHHEYDSMHGSVPCGGECSNSAYYIVNNAFKYFGVENSLTLNEGHVSPFQEGLDSLQKEVHKELDNNVYGSNSEGNNLSNDCTEDLKTDDCKDAIINSYYELTSTSGINMEHSTESTNDAFSIFPNPQMQFYSMPLPEKTVGGYDEISSTECEQIDGKCCGYTSDMPFGNYVIHQDYQIHDDNVVENHGCDVEDPNCNHDYNVCENEDCPENIPEGISNSHGRNTYLEYHGSFVIQEPFIENPDANVEEEVEEGLPFVIRQDEYFSPIINNEQTQVIYEMLSRV